MQRNAVSSFIKLLIVSERLLDLGGGPRTPFALNNNGDPAEIAGLEQLTAGQGLHELLAIRLFRTGVIGARARRSSQLRKSDIDHLPTWVRGVARLYRRYENIPVKITCR